MSGIVESGTAARAGSPEAGALRIHPLSGCIGAEVAGVDLTQDLSDGEVAAIRCALLRHRVIFFRDQPIDNAQQVRFARRFGNPTRAHPYADSVSGDFPEILAVESRASDTGRNRHARFEPDWHTDLTALVNPPYASILRADVVPAYGGDTQWTNLIAAYQNMPVELRSLADTLWAKHAFSPRDGAGSAMTGKMLSDPSVAIHPIVRVHPETGERALYVSPTFTRSMCEILGFTVRQSERLLELFWEEIRKPQYTVRFRWAPGSLAFWDNRSTAHLAPSDTYDLPDSDRFLYRITLEGDVPVSPDGKCSVLVSGQEFRGLGKEADGASLTIGSSC